MKFDLDKDGFSWARLWFGLAQIAAFFCWFGLAYLADSAWGLVGLSVVILTPLLGGFLMLYAFGMIPPLGPASPSPPPPPRDSRQN